MPASSSASQFGVQKLPDPIDPEPQAGRGARNYRLIDKIDLLLPNRLDNLEAGFFDDRLHRHLVHGSLLSQEDIDCGGMGENPLLAVGGDQAAAAHRPGIGGDIEPTAGLDPVGCREIKDLIITLLISYVKLVIQL